MTSKYALPIVVAGSIVLAGCFDGSSSSSDPAPVTTQVRVIHGVSDAPAVNVGIDGDIAIAGADFKQAAILDPAVGSYSVTVDGLLPGGATTTVIGPADLTFEEGIRYDVIASGSVGAGTVAPIVLADDGERTDPDSVRLRVVHLSPDADQAASGPVDVYLTLAADGNALPAEPSFTFSFGEDVGPLEVGADTYRVRVTPENSDTVVYDSGEVPLPSGADLLIGAVDNTGANRTHMDASPVSLIVANGADVTELFDVEQQAGVRAVHNSADAPNVDVLVDNSVAFANLAFPDVVPGASLDAYAKVPAGTRNVKVTPAGNNSDVRIEADLDLVNAQGYTVVALNLLADIEALVLEDSVRSIATQATVRVVHGSTLAGPVNVYLLPEGETNVNVAQPVLTDVPFKANSGYLAVTPGIYNLVVTDDSGNAAIGPAEVNLQVGGIYTAIARDTQALDGADLILLDDFVLGN
ncbi:DUF4397 domain-containing protein [Marinobacter sp. SS13-12]|uniref:DUF4397 domain-containing protein n=1 Tax=Marinobacter sp. SS13-12 TaxID=3050451 RepID=UPI0025564D92|nr:DUF4397 domain-containing protein [Marinobacter sp. SS13-12]MDK8464733.1 DUF4397 domain-containing protein [Marinobacter sp. SS13-12]